MSQLSVNVSDIRSERDIAQKKNYPIGASEFFLGFICNCLSYFTTAKISFTSMLYPQFTHIWSLSYTLHVSDIVANYFCGRKTQRQQEQKQVPPTWDIPHGHSEIFYSAFFFLKLLKFYSVWYQFRFMGERLWLFQYLREPQQ